MVMLPQHRRSPCQQHEPLAVKRIRSPQDNEDSF
jgi:hypothetical protein